VSLHATQHWPCDSRSIAEVRQFVAAQCRQWHLDAVTDDLVLMASEMATNAVTHARSAFQVSMVLANGQVRLEVSDGGPELPPIPAPPWRTTTLTGPDAAQVDHVDFLLGGELDSEAMSGRGLTIVAALAASWGIAPQSLRPGKTIWATHNR
jgi:anti-sigma regulatory factor (Ser/Thr protein kinase)